jgi:hypothetical protein
VRGSSGYGIEIQNNTSAAFENVQIRNIVFENNDLGGVLLSGIGDIQSALENNTFIGGDSGVAIKTNVTGKIRNSIFIGQARVPVRVFSVGDSQVEYSYNLFSLCGASSDCATRWRNGNMVAVNAHDNLFNLDPRFANPALGDYTISPGSPVIDAGDPNTAVFSEQYGVLQVDIGAFESSFMEQLPLFIDDASNLPGTIMNLSSVNTNLRYYIDPTGDEDWFRFYLPKAGGFQVHLTSLPANYDLYVYNAAGQLLGSSTKDKKSAQMVKIDNAASGYYYVRVLGFNGAWNAANSYQLRINMVGIR